MHEGRKSFPSGHTATSFAGLGYSALIIAANARIFDKRNRLRSIKAIIFLAPWSVALLIGLSRMMDYRHHPTDIIGGALIGTTMAIFAFRLYFPSLLEDEQDIFREYREEELGLLPP